MALDSLKLLFGLWTFAFAKNVCLTDYQSMNLIGIKSEKSRKIKTQSKRCNVDDMLVMLYEYYVKKKTIYKTKRSAILPP